VTLAVRQILGSDVKFRKSAYEVGLASVLKYRLAMFCFSCFECLYKGVWTCWILFRSWYNAVHYFYRFLYTS